MIRVNRHLLSPNRFPDGTFASRLDRIDFSLGGRHADVTLEWNYDSDEEMAQIYFITKHLQSQGYEVSLLLSYLPHARMDRVKCEDEIFTLKYFCEFINSLFFRLVAVLDVHSSVALALLDRVVGVQPLQYINWAISSVCKDYFVDELVLFYPDEGAGKRYSDLVNHPYTTGIKKRDWRTGKILGSSVVDPDMVKGKSVLIIDDICSKGGTFYYAAKALKEAGARDVFLYVTHCENTITKGEMLKEDSVVSHIFTTDSILRERHNKISVYTLSKEKKEN